MLRLVDGPDMGLQTVFVRRADKIRVLQVIERRMQCFHTHSVPRIGRCADQDVAHADLAAAVALPVIPCKPLDQHTGKLIFLAEEDPVPRDKDMVENDLALAAGRMAKAVPGGWTQCYAVWVPDDLSHTPYTPLEFYRHVRDYFKRQTAANSCSLARIEDARSAQTAHAWGSVAAMLTVENGSPIGHDLAVVDELAADGVKMLTLTWNGKNDIASGNDTADGMSDFGREAVRALEDHRIVVDVSHLNDAGFSDLLHVATRPFVASHSNSRAVCPHPRNLTDAQFGEIRDRGGLVGINYYRAFIADVPAGKDVTFDQLSRHIDHFLSLGGEKVLALGSDFDGSDTPAWLARCDDVPAFFSRVASRFGMDLARRMFYQNAQEFFERNEVR